MLTPALTLPSSAPSLPSIRKMRQASLAWRGGGLWSGLAAHQCAPCRCCRCNCCSTHPPCAGLCSHPPEDPKDSRGGPVGRGGGGARGQPGARAWGPPTGAGGKLGQSVRGRRVRLGCRLGCTPRPLPQGDTRLSPPLATNSSSRATACLLLLASSSASSTVRRSCLLPAPETSLHGALLTSTPLSPAGTYAEYVAVDEALCCAIPEGVGFLEAGALPVSGLTALQALQAGMPLEGKRVLVHGGAGGVGGFAVQVGGLGQQWLLLRGPEAGPAAHTQAAYALRSRGSGIRPAEPRPRHDAPMLPQIAKAHGAHVTTTCSGRNVEFVTQQLGADAAINYTQVGRWGRVCPLHAGQALHARWHCRQLRRAVQWLPHAELTSKSGAASAGAMGRGGGGGRAALRPDCGHHRRPVRARLLAPAGARRAAVLAGCHGAGRGARVGVGHGQAAAQRRLPHAAWQAGPGAALHLVSRASAAVSAVHACNPQGSLTFQACRPRLLSLLSPPPCLPACPARQRDAAGAGRRPAAAGGAHGAGQAQGAPGQVRAAAGWWRQGA